MKVGIVILSDIHFSDKDNSVIDKIGSLKSAILSQFSSINNLFLCIIGDTANTGSDDEYLLAMDFFEEIIVNIQKEFSGEIHTLFVPGNHDCDFSKNQNIRNALLQQVTKDSNDASDEIIDEILSVQEKYQDFENHFMEKEEKNLTFSNPLIKQYNYNFDDKIISFNLINTSWMSRLNETPGKLLIPTGKLDEFPSNNVADLKISLLHHHLRWLHPDNARQVGRFLEGVSHIVMSGHEHIPENYSKQSYSNSLYFIESGALQTNDEKESYFQTLIFDFEIEKYKHNGFSWDSEAEIYITDHNKKWSSFNEIFTTKNRLRIELNEMFSQALYDPGAPFQHPRKHSLYLEDVFIYPELNEIFIEENNNIEGYYDSMELLTDDTLSNLIFIGNERVGKSALLRKIYIDYLNRGYYPILLNGIDLKKATEENIQKKINGTIKSQYDSKHVIDQYKQLPKEKKVVLIDDLQKSTLNLKGKQRLLQLIEKDTNRIIITTSDLHDVRDLFVNPSENNESQFRLFEIIDFGHKKRAELIEKWNALGQEDNVDYGSFIKYNDQTERQLHTLVKNGQVPSYPFFLLTILQASESMTPHQMKDSTQGHYYDVLISDALARMNIDNSEIDILKNYISHLAYFIYSKRDESFTDVEFKQLHDEFNQKYELSLEFGSYKRKLISSSLIFIYYDSYKFKYSYVYYYFVAKYYSDNLERTKTKEQLKKEVTFMSNNLYNDKYANILMFLIHLSKNEYILGQVMNAAKTNFSELSEITLEEDVNSLNELIKTVPELIIDDSFNIKQNRTDMYERYDDLERKAKTIEKQDLKNNVNDDKYIHKINSINQGFKTIELIGQLLQNYPGYIEGSDKRELSNEAINTGLRILRVFLDQVLEDKDFLLKMTEQLLKDQHIDSADEKTIENNARKILFNLSSWIIFSVIKGISKSLGNKDMIEIINNVIKDNPYISKRLLGISISLDHAYLIPHSDIIDLYKETKDNILTKGILRRMVSQYLHLFEVPYYEKQKVCAAVNINYNQQLTHNAKNKRKAINI